MAIKPNLPLPKGYFGDTSLSPEQERKYRDVVRTRLASALRDEYEFVHVNSRQVDAAAWRLVKKKHQLRIFRRRRAGAVTGDEDTWKPSMLSVGRMEGTLEDVLYGAYDKSYEELKTTIAFADVYAKDCAVLHTLELATPEDPFHYLGMKWFYTQLPASLVVKPRDWCYIEAMGIERDASPSGRFGYIILHSVDARNCPPFDRKAVVRGRTQLSFIFREPVPGIVEIFSQGLFDPAGELIQQFTTVMTSEVLTGVFKMAQCAEAKKLTLLALRNVARDKSGVAKSSDVDKSCSVCRGSGSMFSSLKLCRVCSATVCSQCRVKKSIFVGPQRSVCRVACCRTCLLQAKSMEIRPAEPAFSILGEQHLAPEQFFSTLESSGSDSTPTLRHPNQSSSGGAGGDYTEGSTTDRIDDRDDDDRDDRDDDDDALSELDVNGYRFSNESGISEDDVEKLIAAMLRQRADDGGGGGSSNPGDDSKIQRTSTRSSSDAAFFSSEVGAEDGSGDRRTEARQAETGGEGYLETEETGATRKSRETEGPGRSNSAGGMSAEEAAIYEKIVRLQSAANEVYSITQANNVLMMRLDL